MLAALAFKVRPKEASFPVIFQGSQRPSFAARTFLKVIEVPFSDVISSPQVSMWMSHSTSFLSKARSKTALRGVPEKSMIKLRSGSASKVR